MPEILSNQHQAIRIGDRIRFIGRSGSHMGPPNGTEGTVVDFDGAYAVVDFSPHAWSGGWNCHRGLGHSGRLIASNELERATEPEEIQVHPFFLVRVANDGANNPVEEVITGETFATGTEAALRAKALTVELGYKVQPRRAVLADLDTWRAREQARFTDGTYKPLPDAWDVPPIPDHFVHLSNEKRGWVAFTPNHEFGAQDRQLSLRAGAYAKRYYPDLDEKAIGRLSAVVSCDGQLQFASDAASFRKAYVNGPRSCMSDAFSGLPCHPAEVYAAGDLAIATIENESEEIVARCVVWPERKLFTRAYGDIEKIVTQLNAAGYKRGNHFGAKMLLVKTDDEESFVCPYIDECSSRQGSPESVCIKLNDAEDGLIISDRGYRANETDGCISFENDDSDRCDGSETTYCPACEDYEDEDGFAPVVIGSSHPTRLTRQSWCENCRDNNTFYCDGFGEIVSDNIASYDAANHNTWSQTYCDRIGAVECPVTNLMHRPNDVVAVIVDEFGTKEQWGQDIVENESFVCAGDGQRYSNDVSSTSVDGKTYASHNLPEAEIEEEEPDDEDLVVLVTPPAPARDERGRFVTRRAA